jgi:hypothetical protein
MVSKNFATDSQFARNIAKYAEKQEKSLLEVFLSFDVQRNFIFDDE